jgi:hypothetical protein
MSDMIEIKIKAKQENGCEKMSTQDRFLSIKAIMFMVI